MRLSKASYECWGLQHAYYEEFIFYNYLLQDACGTPQPSSSKWPVEQLSVAPAVTSANFSGFGIQDPGSSATITGGLYDSLQILSISTAIPCKKWPKFFANVDIPIDTKRRVRIKVPIQLIDLEISHFYIQCWATGSYSNLKTWPSKIDL